MARKNIFEIMSSQWDLEVEADRMDRLFTKDLSLGKWQVRDTVISKQYTLYDFVDAFCFTEWKNRGRCIDAEDYLNAIVYDDILDLSYHDHNDFFVLIEIIYNFWKMAEKLLLEEESMFCAFSTDFYHLKDIMDENLTHYNHMAVYDKNTEQLIVIEDKPEVTSVAEIVEPNLSMSILRYNHSTLHGDINAKKAILYQMGLMLEPRRKEIFAINKTLEDNVFYMLNNLHIRHNNKEEKTKYYKKYVANMKDDELEQWYDETYQMILLAILEIDQVERNDRCKILRTNIDGESDDKA